MASAVFVSLKMCVMMLMLSKCYVVMELFKKSLPNSRGGEGETSIESMMQTDSLNRSLLSYIKDMKQYLHATWRIFGFRQRPPSEKKGGEFRVA